MDTILLLQLIIHFCYATSVSYDIFAGCVCVCVFLWRPSRTFVNFLFLWIHLKLQINIQGSVMNLLFFFPQYWHLVSLLHDNKTRKLTLVHVTEHIQMSPAIHALLRVCVCVRVHVALCSFITCVALCNYHHEQNRKLFHNHKTSSCYSFITTHSSPYISNPQSL